MKSFLLGAVILGISGVVLGECPSSQNETDKNYYDASSFFETVTYIMANYAGYPFSPDGTSILMTNDATGVFNAYAQPVSGGEPEALTNSTTNAIFALSYFPLDSRVLFTFDEGGNELDHVYVREEDGTSLDLTPGENVRAGFGGWKEDGTALWLATNERDGRFFDMYEYSIEDGYERSLLFQNDLGLRVAAMSPNGRWIALILPRSSADSDIFLVDLQSENQTAMLITEHEGNVKHAVHQFTPDSTELIYATDEFGEFYQAWTYDLETKEKNVLFEEDWDVEFVTMSRSGRYLVSGINADAQVEISITDTVSGEPLELPELPPGDLRQVRFSNDEQMVAFLINSDTSPSNAFVVDLESQELLQLTNALSSDVCQDDLVEGEIIRYESFDDLEIPSILYKPKGASEDNKVPALVFVHGGPGGQSRKGYSATLQHLVNHDYAILAANNRGSSGYGKTFFHLDDQRHGDVDLQDIVFGKTYLESLDWVDPDAIGIIGGSYGGFMVLAALAFEPEVFEVGIDIFGVANWVRVLENIPAWWEAEREALYDEMGDPATDGERLMAISPLFHADQIQKPLLVVQGANDPRVPQVESDEIVAAVTANGVPVEYLLFEDEGHGFLKKANRIEASEAYVSFLNEYLRHNGTETGEVPTSDAVMSKTSNVVFPLGLLLVAAMNM